MKNEKEEITISIGDWIFEKEDLIKNKEEAVIYTVKNIQNMKISNFVVLECKYGEIYYELEEVQTLFTKPSCLPIRH